MVYMVMDRATRAEMLHVRWEWRRRCQRWLLDGCCLLAGAAQHATGAGSRSWGRRERLSQTIPTSRHLPHPGSHTLGPVVCRLLLMLLCCTGGMLGIEMLIGDYRRCNYEHEIEMGW